jgi:hypothetical protein
MPGVHDRNRGSEPLHVSQGSVREDPARAAASTTTKVSILCRRHADEQVEMIQHLAHEGMTTLGGATFPMVPHFRTNERSRRARMYEQDATGVRLRRR